LAEAHARDGANLGLQDTRLARAKGITVLEERDAGDFATWLRTIRAALRAGSGSDVPCGACNGCCRSSYFIHIGPDESDTIARIPSELLFAAPGLPEGNVVMGYNEHGSCPMLIDDRCSIYQHRPQTCRIYDCRVFTATAIEPPQRRIAQRTQRWRFSYASEDDYRVRLQVQAAARFFEHKADCFPPGFIPANPAQLAVLAIVAHQTLADLTEMPDEVSGVRSDAEVAKAVIDAAREFESN
jgi:Fe-S-cluster containining protein